MNSQIYWALSLYLNNLKTKQQLKILHENTNPDFKQIARSLLTSKRINNSSSQITQIMETCTRDQISIIVITDPLYPKNIKNIPDAPLLLFAKGNLSLITSKCISMIGTRNPSMVTLIYIKTLCTYFDKSSITTVSGYARGCDLAVHKRSIGPGTIAVLPHGILIKKNTIKEHFNILYISEYLPDFPPQKYTYIKRNRIIAAFSSATIFLEGGEKSGALTTLQAANKYHRKIWFLNHPLQKNNNGIRQVMALKGIDITFLFTSITKTGCRNNKEFSYIGNSTFIKITFSDLYLKWILLALRD